MLEWTPPQIKTEQTQNFSRTKKVPYVESSQIRTNAFLNLNSLIFARGKLNLIRPRKSLKLKRKKFHIWNQPTWKRRKWPTLFRLGFCLNKTRTKVPHLELRQILSENSRLFVNFVYRQKCRNTDKKRRLEAVRLCLTM